MKKTRKVLIIKTVTATLEIVADSDEEARETIKQWVNRTIPVEGDELGLTWERSGGIHIESLD